MQWNIGLCIGDIEAIIRQKKNTFPVKWLPVHDDITSVADPFVFKTSSGEINILYEDFSMVDMKKHGTIRLVKINEQLEPVSDKEILDNGHHLSYPSIFFENGITYIIPESRRGGAVHAYEYDYKTDALANKKTIIANLPLLDSTIIKHNGKYWLFATMGDRKFEHSKLYIYYADSLFGDYKPHKKNPVKYSLKGSRPAGNFIAIDGQLYRPAQNCEGYYGKSLIINKVIQLSEDEFEEEIHMELTQEKVSAFSKGIHTINVVDDLIVVDGIRMVFNPLLKLKLFIRKKTGK
jgi:hypothetical protein